MCADFAQTRMKQCEGTIGRDSTVLGIALKKGLHV